MVISIRSVLSQMVRLKCNCDKNAEYVIFANSKPVIEISYRDNKTWSRPYGEPRSVPYRPMNQKGYMTVREIRDHYLTVLIERGSL